MKYTLSLNQGAKNIRSILITKLMGNIHLNWKVKKSNHVSVDEFVKKSIRKSVKELKEMVNNMDMLRELKELLRISLEYLIAGNQDDVEKIINFLKNNDKKKLKKLFTETVDDLLKCRSFASACKQGDLEEVNRIWYSVYTQEDSSGGLQTNKDKQRQLLEWNHFVPYHLADKKVRKWLLKVASEDQQNAMLHPDSLFVSFKKLCWELKPDIALDLLNKADKSMKDRILTNIDKDFNNACDLNPFLKKQLNINANIERLAAVKSFLTVAKGISSDLLSRMLDIGKEFACSDLLYRGDTKLIELLFSFAKKAYKNGNLADKWLTTVCDRVCFYPYSSAFPQENHTQQMAAMNLLSVSKETGLHAKLFYIVWEKSNRCRDEKESTKYKEMMNCLLIAAKEMSILSPKKCKRFCKNAKNGKLDIKKLLSALDLNQTVLGVSQRSTPKGNRFSLWFRSLPFRKDSTFTSSSIQQTACFK